ncbi:MAG TPA: DNA-binding protein WhiA [Clostridia bacterium]|nr:DNA-binding protein WhiA [Bacillota bacterium]HQI15919.1 DNA-binding protein WhiA [Bacillota bacterium]HRS20154.1 DNA-binding protein WhiA [Clostridia bacterium]HRU40966.1 DNA-binding protein WhiA [Candidatus Diapherotrites archaeon]
MTFSSVTKNEISKIAVTNKCCQLALLSALIKMTGTLRIHGIDKIGITLSTENASIARMLFSLLKSCFDINTRVVVRKNRHLKKNNNYTLYIDSDMGSHEILKLTGILQESDRGMKLNHKLPHYLIKKACCRRAYLRGIFLGSGSISDPEKTYHLELVTNNESFAEDIKDLMNHYQLGAKVVMRKGNFVVYIKEGENIVNFLNIIGAHNALLKLENIRIYKEMRNNVNRIVNCETANLDKTLNAALRQIENIEYIKNTIGLGKLPGGLAEIAELRLEFRDATLKELGEMMSPPIGKSGVNHRLRKLDQIAENLRDRHRE